MTCILLIDDNPAQHELFRAYSAATDFQIFHAISIKEAIRILESRSPDIVFLDNRLHPFSDFRETIPTIRKSGYSGRIVVISSDIRHPVFDESRHFSVHSCINKFEFTLSNFEETVLKLLPALQVPVANSVFPSFSIPQSHHFIHALRQLK